MTADRDPAGDPNPGPGPDPNPAEREDEERFAVIPVTEALDLHTFHPREIPAAVAGYLEEAMARGFREVRLIHGKGIGFQRERVRQLLASHPAVEWFGDAPAERGHWGATLVRLRGTLPAAAGAPATAVAPDPATGP